MQIVHHARDNIELRIFEDLYELNAYAAARFADLAGEHVMNQGRFAACLSGGATPQGAYARLAEEPYRDSIPWKDVHIFWGDERCIPLDRPDNHYTMASDLFLRKVGIPTSNIHRMRGEAESPPTAAAEYQWMLQTFFNVPHDACPRFDLILLGMGEDGHTASLYPSTAGLVEPRGLVAAHYVPQRQGFRLTLTVPVLCSAKEVMFMVSGSSKAGALRQVFQRFPDEQDVPARLIKPLSGKLIWLVDEAAAQEIQVEGAFFS